jgi:hypothetical protein
VYDDIELPYPDAKVPEKLCIRMYSFYLLLENNDYCDEDVMKSFILNRVVSNLFQKFPDLLLFCGCFSPIFDKFCISIKYMGRIK